MVNLKAEARKITGRKVKNLRTEGLIPSNIYGKDVKSQAIEVKSKEFHEVYKKTGETGVVEISLGKETRPVLIHNMQIHPVTGEILHVDFLQVDLKQKVTARIPLEIIGESPAEKSGIGTVVLLMQELEVEGLPGDLPKAFEIDATKLIEVDQMIKVGDLKTKGEIEIKADAETIIAKVEPPQKEEVVQQVEPVVAEGQEAAPVEGGEKPAETTEEKKEETSQA